MDAPQLAKIREHLNKIRAEAFYSAKKRRLNEIQQRNLAQHID
jgi:hypothetical protein